MPHHHSGSVADASPPAAAAAPLLFVAIRNWQNGWGERREACVIYVSRLTTDDADVLDITFLIWRSLSLPHLGIFPSTSWGIFRWACVMHSVNCRTYEKYKTPNHWQDTPFVSIYSNPSAGEQKPLLYFNYFGFHHNVSSRRSWWAWFFLFFASFNSRADGDGFCRSYCSPPSSILCSISLQLHPPYLLCRSLHTLDLHRHCLTWSRIWADSQVRSIPRELSYWQVPKCPGLASFLHHHWSSLRYLPLGFGTRYVYSHLHCLRRLVWNRCWYPGGHPIRPRFPVPTHLGFEQIPC